MNMAKEVGRASVRIDEYLKDAMRISGIPGASLGITDRQGILRVSNIGFADVCSRKLVGDETLFEIGSISKSFASVVALQLAEEGKLDLHAPVSRYLPWLKIKSRHAPITMHHLLSHSAGIIMGTEFTGYGASEVTFLGQYETGSPPGTFFWYSNTGYKLVGLIIEEMLGRRFPEIVTERVLAPLGMSRSSAEITHALRARLATGYAQRCDDRPMTLGLDVVPATWFESDTADGSISSTAADMCAYIRMLLGSGEISNRRLLSKESFALFTQRAIEPADAVREEAYGYGLEVYTEKGHSMIGHTGGMVGYTSAMLVDSDLGIGIILLTNGRADTGGMARSVMGALRAEAEGRSEGPEPVDPYRIENAERYAGSYRGERGVVVLRSDPNKLFLDFGGSGMPVENRAPDGLYVQHPSYDTFLLKPEESNGKITGIAYGPDFYRAAGVSDVKKVRTPRLWHSYLGHYRTYNPWVSNFRIVLRLGRLYLIDPSGHEEPLSPISKDTFRVGKDERCPERIRFRSITKGVALEAVLSGCPCFRTFTP